MINQELVAEVADWCDVVNEMNKEGKTGLEMLSSLTYMEAPQWALNTRWPNGWKLRKMLLKRAEKEI